MRQNRRSDLDDGLTYREAFTRDAAKGAEGSLARQAPGKILFVYRKTPAATAAGGSEHPAVRNLAA
jgi:hypothetical protein